MVLKPGKAMLRKTLRTVSLTVFGPPRIILSDNATKSSYVRRPPGRGAPIACEAISIQKKSSTASKPGIA